MLYLYTFILSLESMARGSSKYILHTSIGAKGGGTLFELRMPGTQHVLYFSHTPVC